MPRVDIGNERRRALRIFAELSKVDTKAALLAAQDAVGKELQRVVNTVGLAAIGGSRWRYLDPDYAAWKAASGRTRIGIRTGKMYRGFAKPRPQLRRTRKSQTIYYTPRASYTGRFHGKRPLGVTEHMIEAVFAEIDRAVAKTLDRMGAI